MSLLYFFVYYPKDSRNMVNINRPPLFFKKQKKKQTKNNDSVSTIRFHLVEQLSVLHLYLNVDRLDRETAYIVLHIHLHTTLINT